MVRPRASMRVLIGVVDNTAWLFTARTPTENPKHTCSPKSVRLTLGSGYPVVSIPKTTITESFRLKSSRHLGLGVFFFCTTFFFTVSISKPMRHVLFFFARFWVRSSWEISENLSENSLLGYWRMLIFF